MTQDKTLESCREELDCLKEELEAVSAQKEEVEKQLDDASVELERRVGESQTSLTEVCFHYETKRGCGPTTEVSLLFEQHDIFFVLLLCSTGFFSHRC